MHGMGSLINLPNYDQTVVLMGHIYDFLDVESVTAASQISFNTAVRTGHMAAIILDDAGDLLTVGGNEPVLAPLCYIVK